jgi:hypothetical protein
MKIEGYLFVPYQGQARFSFDSEAPLTRRFGPGDESFDARLGMALTDNGRRHITCSNVINASSRNSQYAGEIAQLILNEVVPRLKKSPANTIHHADLGVSPVNMGGKPSHITCTFIEGSK